MPDPYDLTRHGGKTVDWITHKALLEVERRLGYSLAIMQGSYRGSNGAAASAGTHDRGGVVDLTPSDHVDKVRALREVGFAAWYRNPSQGPWPYHIHAVLIGNTKLAPIAAQQVVDYRNHRSGLRGHVHDATWHPSPIPTFHWHGSGTPSPPKADFVIDLSRVVAATRNPGSIANGIRLKKAVAAEVGKGDMDLGSPRLGAGFKKQYALVQREYLRSIKSMIKPGDDNGVPGRNSLEWLAKRHKFRVQA